MKKGIKTLKDIKVGDLVYQKHRIEENTGNYKVVGITKNDKDSLCKYTINAISQKDGKEKGFNVYNKSVPIWFEVYVSEEEKQNTIYQHRKEEFLKLLSTHQKDVDKFLKYYPLYGSCVEKDDDISEIMGHLSAIKEKLSSF